MLSVCCLAHLHNFQLCDSFTQELVGRLQMSETLDIVEKEGGICACSFYSCNTGKLFGHLSVCLDSSSREEQTNYRVEFPNAFIKVYLHRYTNLGARVPNSCPLSFLSLSLYLFAPHFCLSLHHVIAGYFGPRWSFSMCHRGNVPWHLLPQTILKKHPARGWHHWVLSAWASRTAMTQETLFKAWELQNSLLLQQTCLGYEV